MPILLNLSSSMVRNSIWGLPLTSLISRCDAEVCIFRDNVPINPNVAIKTLNHNPNKCCLNWTWFCIPVYMLQHLWILRLGVHACVQAHTYVQYVSERAFSLFVHSLIYSVSLSEGCGNVSRCLHFPVILKIYCQQVLSSNEYSLVHFTVSIT